MRILFLGNNWVGYQVAHWLREQNEQIVGLVVHPSHKRKYGDEIIRSTQVNPEYIFDGSQLRQSEVLENIKALRPDIGLSVFFSYILRPEFLDLFPSGVVNLHPAYLPYNRGAYPNVWSIVDGTPAGVTLHYIDEGIDTGDIIAQREVPIEPIDTGESLYRKLEQVCIEIFMESWPLLRANQAPRKPQPPQTGTFHRTDDVVHIDEIDLNHRYNARALINVLRARTFSRHAGTYFLHEGRKVYMRLHLEYEDEQRR